MRVDGQMRVDRCLHRVLPLTTAAFRFWTPLPTHFYSLTTTAAILSDTPRTAEEDMVNHWLMKAEPDSRIVKGKDVKVAARATRSLARCWP